MFIILSYPFMIHIYVFNCLFKDSNYCIHKLIKWKIEANTVCREIASQALSKPQHEWITAKNNVIFGRNGVGSKNLGVSDIFIIESSAGSSFLMWLLTIPVLMQLMSSIKWSKKLRPQSLMGHKMCDQMIQHQPTKCCWDPKGRAPHCMAPGLGFGCCFVIICGWSPERVSCVSSLWPGMWLPLGGVHVGTVAPWEDCSCSFHCNLINIGKQFVWKLFT